MTSHRDKVRPRTACIGLNKKSLASVDPNLTADRLFAIIRVRRSTDHAEEGGDQCSFVSVAQRQLHGGSKWRPSAAMVQEKEIVLTAEGYRRFEEELARLIRVKRQEVRDRIRDTKPASDENEDAAYDNAKIEQAFVEGRIQELREILSRARILKEEEIPTDEVRLGSRVRVRHLGSGREMSLRLVSPLEAWPDRGDISIESPVGMALLGRREGDVVCVAAPVGNVEYRIEEIGRS